MEDEESSVRVCVKICHRTVVGIAKRTAAPPVRFLIFEFLSDGTRAGTFEEKERGEKKLKL